MRTRHLVPAALAAVLMLAGCVASTGDEAPATGSPEATGTPTSSAAPAAVLLPEGDAEANKPFFDQTNEAVLTGNPDAGGVEFTSALRSSGFDIAAMQVTPDVTTVGVAADSIQFSVRWGEECLIGQYGHGEYSSIVAPVLGTGTCLIGQTRPIDW
ncbi:hypothetical protein N1031_08525 [Herbiconiux moechotypicola]|uniref:DUF6993 domain-containing protein n=1 Tax=Herbiconiux moechotypicola TaxID=637393 RepID=A0ABP5QDE9_9MICO|nr:hypothetical protein [Herbiconiux moechotypicola]MCS5729803.1 hypothetical protein [Herbiconiux moechotypicola]